MKKSLLILSLMAAASTAFAYDVPVAGTAEKPNYYIAKNTRNYNYLQYSTDVVEDYFTTFIRTNTVDASCIWEVTPGTAEGSVVVKNYTADVYMFGFVDRATGQTPITELTTLSTTAVLMDEPTDIYIEADADGGSCSINVMPIADRGGNYVSLDAANFNNYTCDNWLPADGGTRWYFTQIDLDGNTVEDALEAALIKPEIDEKVAALEKYLPTAAVVSAELQAGIEAIKACKTVADVQAAYDAAIAAANTALETVLNGNEYALKNLRRVTYTNGGAYLITDAEAGSYTAATSYISANALFTFKTAGEGGAYYIYNAATETYMALGEINGAARMVTVAEEADAQVFYPLLNNNGGFYGLSFSLNPTKDGQGLNWHSIDNTQVTTWSVADGGSIWSLVEYDPQAAVDDLAAEYAAAFAKYSDNVPVLKSVFDKAIADIKALTFNEDITAEADAIETEAFEKANVLLTTCYDGATVQIKGLRQNNYLCYNEETNFAHSTNTEAEEVAFQFTAVEGGYVLYNAAVNAYVAYPGELTVEDADAQNAMCWVETEAEAATVLPFVAANGNFYGVALYLGDITEEEEENGEPVVNSYAVGMNQNGQNNLFIYYVADGGSIWGLTSDKDDEQDSISSIKATSNTIEGIYDLQGRKLAAPVKGINIINGVKVLVK